MHGAAKNSAEAQLSINTEAVFHFARTKDFGVLCRRSQIYVANEGLFDVSPLRDSDRHGEAGQMLVVMRRIEDTFEKGLDTMQNELRASVRLQEELKHKVQALSETLRQDIDDLRAVTQDINTNFAKLRFKF